MRGTRLAGSPLFGALILLAFALQPASVEAQFSGPCQIRCGLVLGASSYAVGVGALVAWSRHTGGISSASEGTRIWASGVALTLGGGIALSGNGERQQRSVYASGVGLLAGSAAGLIAGSIRSDGDGARTVAVTLIGAGVGALIGGLYGAVSYDGEAGLPSTDTPPVPLFSVRWAR